MSNGITFDPEAIRALAQILKDTDLTEIELVEKDSRIRVARSHPPAAAASAAPQMAWPAGMMMQAPAAAAPAIAPLVAVAAPAPVLDALDLKHPGMVTSPMVGVAYLSPESGSAPFITLGGKVAKGQTVLLIEAMKTFNQIKATKAGTVTRILIETGTPVEYGEPLLVIE